MRRIAIHSVPRSGSSWLGSIFDSSLHVVYRFQPLFSYTHKDQLTENSNIEEIDNFFKDIQCTDDQFVLQAVAKKNNPIPQFQKSRTSHIVYKEVRYHHILKNLLYKDKNIKVIGLIRNPFAVINSWLNAPKEFKKELNWKVDEEWRDAPKKNLGQPEEFNGYNKWKEAAFLYLKLKKKYPDRFYLLDYNDLLLNKVATVEKLFDFSNLELTQQTLNFLNTSSQKEDKDAYSVFKQKKNDDQWKLELPSFIIEEIKADEDFQRLNQIFQWI